MRRAAELYSGKIVSLRPLIDDLLWDGLTMLIANPKAGKFWLTLQCAVFIAGDRKVEGMTALDHGTVFLETTCSSFTSRNGPRLRD